MVRYGGQRIENDLRRRKSMKILFVSPAYKPAYRYGGPVISVSGAAENLAKKGHEVTVFTTNSNLDEDLQVSTDEPHNVSGVEVWYFRKEEPFKRWLPFIPYLSKSSGYLYAPAMYDHLIRIVPRMDVVHTHMPFVYTTYAAFKAAQCIGKPLFYHQRGGFDRESLKFRGIKKNIYIKMIEREILCSATTLIALTNEELINYRSMGINTPCHVIPNGIDVTKFSNGTRTGLNNKWNIPENALVVLFFGRLHPTKGAEKILDAFIMIHDDFPDALLIMAGPDEWGLEDRFRNFSNNRGISQKVIFTGMVAGEDKLYLLARANLFCLPSRGEGFSNAVLEALASATPVLLSPGCHFPEVESARVGKIVNADSSLMASALKELLSYPEKLQEMGREGREFVRKYYSWDTITDRLIDVYNEGINRYKQRNRIA
jgi:glycosyltransferase involved in cell wall biosynthesis